MTENILHFNKKPNYQRIQKDKVVRLRYLLRDVEADETLAFRDDMYYLHGGYGSAFPKVEETLDDLEVGMKAELTLRPEDAYGELVSDLVMKVPTDAIPEQARHIGMEIEGEGQDGHTLNFRVIDIDQQGITVDGNHPLAGKTLHFSFEVLDIRQASDQEIKAGYAYSPENSSNMST